MDVNGAFTPCVSEGKLLWWNPVKNTQIVASHLLYVDVHVWQEGKYPTWWRKEQRGNERSSDCRDIWAQSGLEPVTGGDYLMTRYTTGLATFWSRYKVSLVARWLSVTLNLWENPMNCRLPGGNWEADRWSWFTTLCAQWREINIAGGNICRSINNISVWHRCFNATSAQL